MACNSCNSCNTCNTCPSTNPCVTPCKSQITSADLADLIYIEGLDINLCKKYSPVVDVMGLIDCEGDPITAGTAIVTCAALETEICGALSDLVPGAIIAQGTILIGRDCLTHAMPAFQAPLTIADTNCIDLTLAANVLSANPIIAPGANNILECTATGLSVNICDGISQLPVGAPITVSTPLIGVDCLTHSMPPFQPPIAVLDTNCINLTLTGGVTISADPIISPTVGNVLTCTANGLFVPTTVVPAETPITPVDTNCINLTVSGVNNHTLKADITVSPTTGNSAVCTANGLFVPDLCTQLGDVGGLVLPAEVGDVFVTVDCLPRTLPANGGITVSDTVTIDLTLIGGDISGDVNVSSVPDNILTIRPDGLAVRCTDVLTCIPDVIVTAVDTNCFDLTVTEAPTNTFTISGSPIISPTAGNVLTCTANGLYAPATVPVGGLTCATLQDVYVDNGNPLVAGDQVVTVAGCEVRDFPLFVGLDTQTVDTTVTQVGSTINISSTTIIATTAAGFPLGCNGIQNTATGLTAPPNSTGGQVTSYINSLLFNGTMNSGDSVTSSTFTVNIVNPSSCRSAVLVLQAYVPQVATGSVAPGIFAVDQRIFESFNLPTILVTPFTLRGAQQIIDNDTTLVTARAGNDSWPSVILSQFVVPPSFVGSYSVNLVASCFGGSGTVLVANPACAYFLYTI